MNAIYEIDKNILFFFNRTIHSDGLNAFFIFFSDRKTLFVVLPVIIIIGYIIKKKDPDSFKRYLTAVVITFIAVGISDLISARIIKPIFARPRPCQVLENLYYWKSKADLWVLTDGISSYKSSFSFVSTHASNSMAAAVISSLFYRKLTLLFVFISLIVGISRLYLGVHYPSDVISGWIFGAVLGLILYKIYLKSKVRFP